MPNASRAQTAAAIALLTVASIGSARATVPVNYGTTELGQILSTCFYVCFGSNCSAPGTVSSIAVNPPFLVRGIRIAESESPSPCDPERSLTYANLTLPQTVGAGQALVFDVDLLPTSAGSVVQPLSVNGQEHFELQAFVNFILHCTPGITAMCLSNDRFKVRTHWRAFDGDNGAGPTVPGSSPDSGLFWFFQEDNWEALVKMVNACSFNDRYWVFSAATTNVEYTLTVTDTESQTVKSYFNPMGNPAAAVTDTSAFATCP